MNPWPIALVADVTSKPQEAFPDDEYLQQCQRLMSPSQVCLLFSTSLRPSGFVIPPPSSRSTSPSSSSLPSRSPSVPPVSPSQPLPSSSTATTPSAIASSFRELPSPILHYPHTALLHTHTPSRKTSTALSLRYAMPHVEHLPPPSAMYLSLSPATSPPHSHRQQPSSAPPVSTSTFSTPSSSVESLPTPMQSPALPTKRQNTTTKQPSQQPTTPITSTATTITTKPHPQQQSAPIPPTLDMASCPALPLLSLPTLPTSSPPIPARHQSLPPALPLLDLSALPAVAAAIAPEGPHSARRSVDAIATSLSHVRPYLLLGSQASLQHLINPPLVTSPSLSCDSPFALTPHHPPHTPFSSSSTSSHSSPTIPTHVISFTSGCTPQIARRFQPYAATRSGRPITTSASMSVTPPPLWKSTQFPLRDDVRQSIDHVLLPVALTIDEARAKGGRIALVCAQGISRSAACAMAYLMLREGLTVDGAMSAARAARPIVAPNSAFMEALGRLEVRLRCGRDVDWWGVVRRVGSRGSGGDGRSVEISSPLRRAFYGGEGLRGGSATHQLNGVHGVSSDGECSAPFVAEDIAADEIALSAAPGLVVLVERKRRGGVAVWVGRYATNEAREAAVKLAEGMGQQQRDDYERFGGACVDVGHVVVAEEGEDPALDEEVASALGG